MGHKNNGQGENNALQNQFTAYLQTALRRRKRDYMDKLLRVNKREIPVDFQAAQFSDDSVETAGDDSSVEYGALMQALSRLTARERYILFERILNERSYEDLAAPLGLRYSGVSAAYRRIIQKLRQELGEGKK